VMNLKIKFRESFRPFAPIVRVERSHEYFDLPPGAESPYMLLVAPVRLEKRVASRASEHATALDRVRDVRSVIPAVTHVDHSARIQTVDRAANPRYYAVIEAFRQRTGVPVILNTSFNKQEPIVARPEEAISCFLRTEMDALVLGDFYCVDRNAAAVRSALDSFKVMEANKRGGE